MITGISEFGFFLSKNGRFVTHNFFPKKIGWNPYFYSVFGCAFSGPWSQKKQFLDTLSKKRKFWLITEKLFFCIFVFFTFSFLVFLFFFFCLLFFLVLFCFLRATSPDPKPSLLFLFFFLGGFKGQVRWPSLFRYCLVLFLFFFFFPFFASNRQKTLFFSGEMITATWSQVHSLFINYFKNAALRTQEASIFKKGKGRSQKSKGPRKGKGSKESSGGFRHNWKSKGKGQTKSKGKGQWTTWSWSQEQNWNQVIKKVTKERMAKEKSFVRCAVNQVIRHISVGGISHRHKAVRQARHSRHIRIRILGRCAISQNTLRINQLRLFSPITSKVFKF